MVSQSSRAVWLLVALLVTMVACEKNDSPTAPTPSPSCSFTVSASSLSFTASGGSNSVNVSTAANCSWTAASDRGWMAITSGATGSGNGAVTVNLTANAGTSERTATLTVAGQSVAVRQDGVAACSYEIAPASATYTKDGATGSFNVTAPGHCSWTATSNAAWVAVTAGQGAGAGTVTYTVDRNRDAVNRSGTITVAEKTFTITQSGDLGVCEYSVSQIQFNPCMSAPYDLTTTITTRQGCTWTAAPGASWIAVTGGQSGTGSGTVTFRVSDNWDLPRQGVVMLRWPTVTAGQNLQVMQAGCRYSVSVAALTVAAAGGTSRFDVYQMAEPLTCGGPLQNACPWTAEPQVPWITITTSMPQAGDNPVSFAVAPNTTGAARTGTIRVRDKVVTVTQTGS